jgi:hypothetical protein
MKKKLKNLLNEEEIKCIKEKVRSNVKRNVVIVNIKNFSMVSLFNETNSFVYFINKLKNEANKYIKKYKVTQNDLVIGRMHYDLYLYIGTRKTESDESFENNINKKIKTEIEKVNIVKHKKLIKTKAQENLMKKRLEKNMKEAMDFFGMDVYKLFQDLQKSNVTT